MNARLLILLVIALGLVIYFVTKDPATPKTVMEYDNDPVQLAANPDKYAGKMNLSERPLPGEEPPIPPDFSVKVEVDQTSGKNRLYFYVTEAHGYYCETLRMVFWYQKPGEEIEPELSLLRVPHYMNDYIKANETFKGHIEVVPAELSSVGGDIGSTENWRGKVLRCHRARVKNPDPLPPRPAEKPKEP